VRVPFVDLRWQVDQLRDEINAAISRCFDETSFVQGRHVRAFESSFAEYCGSARAVGCGSGTDALYLALWSLGVGPGDEVIVPSMTFIATAEAVSMLGATPVFCDVRLDDGTIDVESAEASMSARTKAIVPVHLWGKPCEVASVAQLSSARSVPVVWDAAQAHGATVNGEPVSSFGGISCFSFYPGKNLGAFGDAGACVSDDEEAVLRMGMMRNHGRSSKYEHEFPGVNMRMDELQAAVLAVKLRVLDQWNELRAQVASIYIDELGGIGDLCLPQLNSSRSSAWHLFVVQSDHRDAMLQHLREQGIGCGIHYPVPLHMQAAYASLKARVPLDNSAKLGSTVLSLPVFPGMSPDQVAFVLKSVKQFFA